MNFLEAHKIVHQFADVVAEGTEDKDDFFMATDRLPFPYDKDRIVLAFQIFVSHTIFFQTRTPEEFEKYKVLYMTNISRFLPRDQLLKLRKFSKIIGNKNPLYKLFNKDKIEMAGKLYGQMMGNSDWLNSNDTYRMDDIFCTIVRDMQEYRKSLVEELKKVSDDKFYSAYDHAVDLYAEKAYKIANIEYKPDYYFFYQDFKTLRELIKKDKYKGYFIGYEDYIRTGR
jgi:hypothetical protein